MTARGGPPRDRHQRDAGGENRHGPRFAARGRLARPAPLGCKHGKRRELRVRPGRHSPRAEHQIGGEPPVSQLSSAATSGTNGWSNAERSPSPSNGATTERHRVRDHRVRGHRAELEEEDRRRREPRTRSTPRRPLPPPAVTDIPSSRPIRRGTSVKIAATAANESWKPGRAGCRGSTRAARARRGAGTTSDPAREHTSRRGTPARRRPLPEPPTVGRRRRARMHRSRPARRPGPPCAGCRARDEEHAAGDERDILAGDGEQVVGPMPGRHPEGPRLALRPPRARSRAARHAARRRHQTRARCRSQTGAGRQPRRGLLGDRRPRISPPQDHVDTVTPEPGALVEPVLVGPRLGHDTGSSRIAP